ncbi:uncharacterized protein LOC130433589 isoform X3 [Triplophysa dalaica]|uniref:uncharacterized protein LOC130433589 isoform X3 n=1 Tax=Triplophysa dalaica TaxID=1582913 RepID=UPI0024DFF69C|nr:uncharacterized protein LOC130433589 isoform X3 [Triplophysa dalaica]
MKILISWFRCFKLSQDSKTLSRHWTVSPIFLKKRKYFIRAALSEERKTALQRSTIQIHQKLTTSLMMKTLLFISIYLLGQVDRAAETVSGIVGESLVINCPYNKKTEKDRERSFCKKNTNKCATLRGEQSNLWTDGGRFSMHDNTSVGLLSVFIKNLTNNDQGTYECKVENKSDLKLKLEEPVEHDSYVIIIIVCVCLILMAAGGLILLWYKLGCKKNAGSKSSSNQRTSIDCQEQSTVVYYETIDESKTGSATVNPTVNVCTVYTTAELPTIPSDRDFYTMAESPERPADP